MVADLPIWAIYVPGFMIVIAAIVIFRMLIGLSQKVNEHAERISFLEGQAHKGSSHDQEA